MLPIIFWHLFEDKRFCLNQVPPACLAAYSTRQLHSKSKIFNIHCLLLSPHKACYQTSLNLGQFDKWIAKVSISCFCQLKLGMCIVLRKICTTDQCQKHSGLGSGGAVLWWVPYTHLHLDNGSTVWCKESCWEQESPLHLRKFCSVIDQKKWWDFCQ